MQRSGLILAALLPFLTGCAEAEPVPYGSEHVSFRPLPAVTDPQPLSAQVRYVGGYAIEAHGTSQVEGLSDLQLSPAPGGLKVDAISDLGAAVTFYLRDDGRGAFADSPVRIDALRQEDGQAYNDRNRNDAEDLAVDPATGAHLVSFERVQRVVSYDRWTGAGKRLALGGLPSLPDNSGMEGLTVIVGKSGGLLIGVESGGFFLCPMQTLTCGEVDGPSPPGFLYMLTSLAAVPGRDGDALALYRYYDPIQGPRNILSLLRYDKGKLTRVADLARIAPPMPYDNYEGVAAVATATGYRLYLISDGLNDGDAPHLLIYDWTP